MKSKILALVNGREISENEIENAILRFSPERQSYFKSENGRKQLLDQLISFELIYNYAKETGMENEELYIKQLEAAKVEILTQVAINKEMSGIMVSDDEVEKYYNENKNQYNSEETVSAKHILVDTIAEANDVLAKINQGIEFEKAAMLYSKCPSKAQGGSLGSFGRGMMVPEFEQAAFSLPIGVISEPVKTQFGYHIIKVEERNQGKAKTFAEVKEGLKAQLTQEKQNNSYMSLVNKLKKKYSVEIK
jgi:peptidyl-prolyl cis-trans isomerase C